MIVGSMNPTDFGSATVQERGQARLPDLRDVRPVPLVFRNRKYVTLT